MNKFAKVKYETRNWNSSIDVSVLSRRQRDMIRPTYLAALPTKITDVCFPVPDDLNASISDILVRMVRFDALHMNKPYNFPSVLLRSES